MIDTVVTAGSEAISLRDLDPTLDFEAAIARLKRERNAVILAHYYQDAEIQDIADFIGDSLDLSRKAAAAEADVIVFCGVKFMAEVAKILSPGRTVLIPDADAGCSLESSCPPDAFRAWREQHPDHLAITYINCSAEVKALSDIIVTSSSAERIISQIPPGRPILFAPDRFLGAYLARKTGRDMKLWPGTCVVHEQFSEREIVKLRMRHPQAKLAAHPECPESILNMADFVGSTSALLNYVASAPDPEFIIATEPHIIHQMQKKAPGKHFIAAPGMDESCSCNNCPFMALNTMEKLYLSLVNMAPRIEMSEELRRAAEKPLMRMLEMSAPPAAKSASAA